MVEEKNSKKKGKSKSFFIYMIICLMFVEILDTYTTLFPTSIPSKVIGEFLIDPFGLSINVANSIFALCIAIATIGTYFVFFNQFLADKFGRKILLVFTVFGMGFASLLMFFSTSIIEYTIYLFLLYIFFSSDIWVIYLNEECPSDKRALWTNIVLMGGVGGALLLPVFRSIFITETSSYWRGMTIFPIFLGIVLSVIIFFTFKETSKFKEMKENRALKEKGSNSLKESVKLLFKSVHRKELIVILIISLINNINYVFFSLMESFFVTSSNLSESDINIAILIISASVILGYLITGIIADKYGRKPLFYVYSIVQPIAIVIAVLTVYLSLSSANTLILISLSAGLAYICSQGLTVVIRIVTLEIVPTDARGTGSGLKSLIAAIGMTVGLLLSSLSIYYFGLGTTFILLSLPLLINIPLIYFYLKETKGIDLSEIS